MEKIIGPKPDYEVQGGDVDDENIMLSQEMPVEVGENDDDVAHMNGHQQFKREMRDSLTPESLRTLSLHILEHRFNHTNKLQQLALVNAQGGQIGQTGENSMAGVPSFGGMGKIQGPRVGGSGGTQIPQVPSPGQA